MTDKELISKLNGLKGVRPAADWKQSNRDILFSQITAGQEARHANWFKVFINFAPAEAASIFSAPVAVFTMVALAVLGGGFFSLRAAENTKPGDSLYIAKIINEKTQLALTFDSKSKAKLNLEYAGNRAQEASQVASEDLSESQKTEQISALSDNFKKELTAVKSRIAKSNPNLAAKTNDNDNTDNAGPASEESIKVFGSNLDKADGGMQVSDAPTAAKVLDEAEQLFANNDFKGSIDKIKEANELMDEEDVIIVPSMKEPKATSTTGTATSTK